MFKVFFIAVLFLSLSFGQVVQLRQRDFDRGTYIIDQPGEYRIMEDIVFNPNSVADVGPTSYESGDVLPSQFTFNGGIYDPAAYGIGFFAAIAISAHDATLDLNGFTISQHPEHALQQRFFAIIELASAPFIPNQGPHDFSPNGLTAATNVVVKNGHFGLSSHHGIHGNSVVDVTLQDLTFSDYEVAAIAINGANGLVMERITSFGSRTDVPIYGSFSAGRFIRPYVNYLRNTNYQGTLRVNGDNLDIDDIYSDLRNSLNNAYEDIIGDRNGQRGGFISKSRHPDEFALYHNDQGVVDGNAYGILLNKVGVAVNAFPSIPADTDASRNVHISDVEVRNHIAHINEIPLLSGIDGVGVIDPVGSAFQVFNTNPDDDDYVTISSSNFSQARYLGNAVANAQAFVAKAILAGAFDSSSLSVTRSSISSDVLAWVEGENNMSLQDYLNDYGVYCNGDTMFHANKGVIGFKLDGSTNVVVENVVVDDVRNTGELGLTICNYNPNEISNPNSVLTGYQGAHTRGFSVSGSVNVDIIGATIEDIYSSSGSAYGIDVLLDSHDISISDTTIKDIHASTEHNSVSDYVGPNADPNAIGIHAPTTSARVTTDNIDGSTSTFSNAAGGLVRFIHNLSAGGQDFYQDNSSNISGDSSNGSPASSSDSSSSASTLVPFGLLFALFYLF